VSSYHSEASFVGRNATQAGGFVGGVFFGSYSPLGVYFNNSVTDWLKSKLVNTAPVGPFPAASRAWSPQQNWNSGMGIK
jgi:hypothetical protein